MLLLLLWLCLTIIMEVFPTSTNSSTYGRKSSQIPHFYISEAYERTLAGSDAQRCSAGNGRNWEAGPTHSIAKMKTWWFKQLNCINIYKTTNIFEILGLVDGFAQTNLQVVLPFNSLSHFSMGQWFQTPHMTFTFHIGDRSHISIMICWTTIPFIRFTIGHTYVTYRSKRDDYYSWPPTIVG